MCNDTSLKLSLTLSPLLPLSLSLPIPSPCLFSRLTSPFLCVSLLCRKSGEPHLPSVLRLQRRRQPTDLLDEGREVHRRPGWEARARKRNEVRTHTRGDACVPAVCYPEFTTVSCIHIVTTQRHRMPRFSFMCNPFGTRFCSKWLIKCKQHIANYI